MDLGTVAYHKLVVTKVWLPWLQWLSGLLHLEPETNSMRGSCSDYPTTIIPTTEHLVSVRGSHLTPYLIL